MTIGQNIKTFRNKQGLTQSKLSELTGIAEVTIRKYESGKITPKSKNLNRLAKGLGVSPSDLDETLKEMISRWDIQNNTDSLSSESKMFDFMIEHYGEDVSSTINDLLSLNPEGQQKVSEYIQDLIPKYQKK